MSRLDSLHPSPASALRAALLAFVVLLLVLGAVGVPTAGADDGSGSAPAQSASPGVAAPNAGTPNWATPGWVVVIGLGALLAIVGVGCAIAVLGAVLPRVATTMERQAKESGGGAFLYGSLTLLGIFAALALAARVHAHVAAGLAILLGVPAFLLLLAGSLGTFPMLGERLLGAKGATASPLLRSIVAALALGLGLAPGLARGVEAWVFLLGLVVTGWPLGVGIAATLHRYRGARAGRAKAT